MLTVGDSQKGGQNPNHTHTESHTIATICPGTVIYADASPLLEQLRAKDLAPRVQLPWQMRREARHMFERAFTSFLGLFFKSLISSPSAALSLPLFLIHFVSLYRTLCTRTHTREGNDNKGRKGRKKAGKRRGPYVSTKCP